MGSGRGGQSSGLHLAPQPLLLAEAWSTADVKGNAEPGLCPLPLHHQGTGLQGSPKDPSALCGHQARWNHAEHLSSPYPKTILEMKAGRDRARDVISPLFTVSDKKQPFISPRVKGNLHFKRSGRSFFSLPSEIRYSKPIWKQNNTCTGRWPLQAQINCSCHP